MNKPDAASVKKIFAKADAMFSQADEIFEEADKLFDAMTSEPDEPPKGGSHEHHIRFCSTSTANRLKMARQFAGMSLSMLLKGKAHLRFKEKNDKKK